MQYVAYAKGFPTPIGPARKSIKEAIKALRAKHEGCEVRSVHTVDANDEISRKAVFIA